MAETRKAKYTNGAPDINWDRVATLEAAFDEAAVGLKATITEAGIAFNQFVIHQTRTFVESQHERD